MSFPSPCPGCMRGNHEEHNRDHGIRKGLIGGTFCPCKGECVGKDETSDIRQLVQENINRRD